MLRMVNKTPKDTTIHWHGIELESYSDGVPGWGGDARRIPPSPRRAPRRGAFVPPRAGTFIYHTHANEQLQMGSGLYGALVVVSDGTTPSILPPTG